jgi:glutamate N-acetyltransferase/amino-acid N-acetyltransferase
VNTQASVTAAKGFRTAGIAAGIKEAAPDLTLVVNDGPLDVAAGVFTSNQVKAAPVLWSRQVLEGGKLRAVVLNSGCANACTGPRGFQDTHATAEKVAQALEIGAIEVGVCSTGLIGANLPMDALLSGVDGAVAALGTGADADLAAATAVLTTDTKPKQAEVSGDGWTVGGFAKGAGMCAPNMATMLSVITTDAVVDADVASKALAEVTQRTYNTLDVDGGTSTNDTVLLLASGASGVSVTPQQFQQRLHEVCADLVKQLQADAEGATKEVTIEVVGAGSERDAITIARTVAEDALVKTALFGSDANWGRIAMAAGRADAPVAADELAIRVNGISLCANGVADQDRESVDMTPRQVQVLIGVGGGAHSATVLTTDLSHGYVEENSAYSS